MTRLALQPRWLAWHLLLVAVLVSFTWLGRWQLSSFEHKAAGAPQPGAAVPLDRLSTPGGRLGADDLGRRVRASGRYDGRALLVPGREKPGGGPDGFLVVSPLRTATGVLPVVRGWVRTASTAHTPAGPVRVTGLLQRSEDGPAAGAPAVVRAGQLPYVATVTLLDALPYQPGQLYDGYLALRSEDPRPASAPLPVQAQSGEVAGGVSRWRNLAYALQWWLFAAAAVFFWWTVLSRAAREQREQEPDPGAGQPTLAAPRRTT